MPLDHFDPEGVEELRRTFTQQSQPAAGRSAASLPLNARKTKSTGALKSKANVNEGKNDDGRSDAESTATAVSDEEPDPGNFDFEQRLKEIVFQ